MLQGAAAGAGVGENRVALRNRAAPGDPIDGLRGRAESVAQRCLKRQTRVWGGPKCGQNCGYHVHRYTKCCIFFFEGHKILLQFDLKWVKKEPGVMPGRLGLRTLVKPPS